MMSVCLVAATNNRHSKKMHLKRIDFRLTAPYCVIVAENNATMRVDG